MAKSTTAPARSDPHTDPIHLAADRTVVSWSWVLDNLAVLLGEPIRGHRNNRRMPGASFHAVINSNSKLELVDAVAQRTLGGRRLERWDKLHGRIGRKVKTRNEIRGDHSIHGSNISSTAAPVIADAIPKIELGPHGHIHAAPVRRHKWVERA